MSYHAQRVSGFGTSIFPEMSALAELHNAVDLADGYPDYDGPDAVKEAAVKAIRDGLNQYAAGPGEIALREAIAGHAARFYGQEVDPETEVLVTSGATQALFAMAQGLVDPGDEVVIFEPFYESYGPDVTMAGGVPRFVPLRPAGPDGAWVFDPDELKAAFNERTKLILVNTPHNPTGKVFTRDELMTIAGLAQQWDVVVVSDEVYEHVVFDGKRHIRFAMLPDMADRAVTISSQGKTYNFTGWGVGWVIAPPPLRDAIRRASQFIISSAVAPMQAAVTAAFDQPGDYYQSLAADLQERRDFLYQGLQEAGLRPLLPGGTYFIMADFSPLGLEAHGVTDDRSFARHLIAEAGVAAIPPSPFYSAGSQSLARSLVRFAFPKSFPTLEEAVRRLKTLTG